MGKSDSPGNAVVESLVEEGAVEDAEAFRTAFESRFGVNIEEAAELESLFDEYAAELEAVHERFAEELAAVDFFERYGADRAVAAELRAPPRPESDERPISDAPGGSGTALATLRELRALHEEDVLTDNEFESKKKDILDRI
ncbi:hypothetical protein NDI54_04470 [Haloarcula sp. S1AR25-5A]|uniref:SHOCT domain-containing protein n=1 Tax=Haloarcula terrestris TaxID=2950533 RepID=A0AAE4EXQ2_9EURY|nr:hypothetical protein [Haloarcula terrestris]MDS0220603.1 hypothetical protein [Haloarcula terrestris]